ncbi:MAG TPA: hypothetical protein VMQ58_01255, partial [Candidatus Saccharimonadales bacterium]|nr:hypothetical protein [Candidatus Saccharimonadales bacterium]
MSWWFFRRKLHISWLIAFGCGGVFIGVFLAQYIRSFYISSIFSLIVAILLIGVTLWRKYIYLIPFLIIGGVLFGLWRGSVSQDELAQFEPLYNKVISISGNVKDDVDTGSSDQIVIRLDN